MLLLSRHQVENLLTMKETLDALEHTFRLEALGKTVMPPKLYLELPEYQGDFRAMPAYVDGHAGIKWVSVYPNNVKRGLPSVLATIILCDPGNGLPLAIMDGTFITGMRTGAAGGVAVKYLARKSSSTIGMVGAGVQARTQLMAISEVMPRIELVKVFDIDAERSHRYARDMKVQLNINVRPVPTIEEACNVDVLVTTTPSNKPVVLKHYVRPGTHINAIGADAKGKQELETDLIKSAKTVVDDIRQACHSGEINVPMSEGKLSVEDIYGTLGEVVAGIKNGRTDDKEVTIFDSTGLAIQDIVCAGIIYARAKEKLPLVPI